MRRREAWVPTAWDCSAARAILAAGGTMPEVAERFGVALGTLKRRRADTPALAAALREGQQAKLRGHGTNACYVRGCRCDLCRAAEAQLRAALRAKHQAQAIPARVSHGTVRCYREYGCRCPDCKAAQAAKNRDYYNRVTHPAQQRQRQT